MAVQLHLEERQASSTLLVRPSQNLRKGSAEVCLEKLAQERRATRRYELHLPIHYRISLKGESSKWNSATTREMSTTGLSFRTRKPLPVGSHVEMILDWPAKYEDQPIDLQLTGFIVRSDAGRTAVRITSRRFRINSQFMPYQATA